MSEQWIPEPWTARPGKKRELEIPHRLAKRPRWRGLPIPFIACITPSGEPDFRLIDYVKRQQAMTDYLCQLCGEKLGRYIHFIGGPKSAEALLYFEPPAHLDCLIYAMQVCPFIMGSMEHAELAKVQADNPTIHCMQDASYTTEKCEWWVIVKATGYTVGLNTDQTTLLKPTGIQQKSPPLHAQSMLAGEWAITKRLMCGELA